MARSGHAWTRYLLFAFLCSIAEIAGAQAVTKTIGDDATIEFPAAPVADVSHTGFALNMPVDDPSPNSIFGAARISMPLWVRLTFQHMPDVSPDMFVDKLSETLGNEPGFKLIKSEGVEVNGYPGVAMEIEISPSLITHKEGCPDLTFPGLEGFRHFSGPVHVQGLLILIKGNFYMVIAGSTDAGPESEQRAEHFLGSFKPTDVHVPGDLEQEAARFGAIVLGILLLMLVAVIVTIVQVVKRIKRKKGG